MKALLYPEIESYMLRIKELIFKLSENEESELQNMLIKVYNDGYFCGCEDSMTDDAMNVDLSGELEI